MSSKNRASIVALNATLKQIEKLHRIIAKERQGYEATVKSGEDSIAVWKGLIAKELQNVTAAKEALKKLPTPPPVATVTTGHNRVIHGINYPSPKQHVIKKALEENGPMTRAQLDDICIEHGYKNAGGITTYMRRNSDLRSAGYAPRTSKFGRPAMLYTLA